MADLCFVLLAESAYPDADAVIAAASDMGLELTLTEREGPLGFSMETGGQLFVMLMPVPHPDVPKMPFGLTAPPKDEALAAPAHLIVTALGLVGTPRQKDLQMAALTACVMEGAKCVGAMFGHGRFFHLAGLFAEMAKLGAELGELPAEIAVDVTAAPEPEDRMSFLTHGLARYGREEFFISCPVNGRGALDFVFSMARWMLDDPDKQLPTGDTLGRSEDETLLIQRQRNPTGSDDTVIRLDLDG
ncbi:MAG: hypothetical protein GW913_03930 [Myxococcales bacterium]|nr:hypothetical protein [Myxococcales bacterium]